MPATRLLTVAQVAELWGWPYKRTVRALHAVNRQLHGMLLVNVRPESERPRWAVSEGALARAFPGFGAEPRTAVSDALIAREMKRNREVRCELKELRDSVSRIMSVVQHDSGRVA